MTLEENRLLWIDLCPRLPYGVICEYTYTDGRKEDFKFTGKHFYYLIECKPYLRSMSSMTEEEKEELKKEHKKDERIYVEVIERIANGDEHARGTAVPHFAVDWCNAHHFDYRGLIEKGLALEAPKDMYKTE